MKAGMFTVYHGKLSATMIHRVPEHGQLVCLFIGVSSSRCGVLFRPQCFCDASLWPSRHLPVLQLAQTNELDPDAVIIRLMMAARYKMIKINGEKAWQSLLRLRDDYTLRTLRSESNRCELGLGEGGYITEQEWIRKRWPGSQRHRSILPACCWRHMEYSGECASLILLRGTREQRSRPVWSASVMYPKGRRGPETGADATAGPLWIKSHTTLKFQWYGMQKERLRRKQTPKWDKAIPVRLPQEQQTYQNKYGSAWWRKRCIHLSNFHLLFLSLLYYSLKAFMETFMETDWMFLQFPQ